MIIKKIPITFFAVLSKSVIMSLNANGVGAEGLLAAAGTLARPSEEFGNDERVEALWAMKAYEHAEVYFNILCCVDPSQIPRLSPCDEEIYTAFRKEFPDMKVDVLDEIKDLKSDAMKKRWREFCEAHKDVEDYSFATLLRLDSSGEYEEQNSVIVTKIQFYAIELARNREGHNSSIRHKFKPKPRKARNTGQKSNTNPSNSEADAQAIINESVSIDKREIEHELKQILIGQHPMLQ